MGPDTRSTSFKKSSHNRDEWTKISLNIGQAVSPDNGICPYFMT